MINNPLLYNNHHEIRERIRAFAEKEIAPLTAKLDEQEVFSVELTKKMGKEKLLGAFVPEKYGGHGMDYLSFIIAIEELARVDSSQAATISAHNALGIAPILNWGTEEQKQKFLPKLTTGEHLWAFGLTEQNAGSDSRGTETTAKLEGNEWVLNGEKMFISNASSPITAGVTLQAITGINNEKKELSVILAEYPNPGITAKPMKGKMMWRATDTSRLMIKNCHVPEENLLGERGKGPKVMLSTLDSGRLTIAAIGLGLAQGAFEAALEYAGKRKQFGKKISGFQSIAFKLADMDMKIELARNLLYKACWMKEKRLPFGKESAMAKLYASEIAQSIANETVQIFGAHGLLKSSPVERFYRDQRLLQIGEGTSEILRIVISRHLGCES